MTVMEAPSVGFQSLTNRIVLAQSLGEKAGVAQWSAYESGSGRPLYVLQVRIPERADGDIDRVAVEYLKQSVHLQSAHPDSFPRSVAALRDGAFLWLVEERPPGTHLGELVARGDLSRPKIAEIGLDILEALSRAHAKGVVRGYISARQVWVDETGSVILSGSGFGALLTSGWMFGCSGSPNFAPEVRPLLPLRPSVDMWALGRILNFALVGLRGDARPFAPLLSGLQKRDADSRISCPMARRFLLRLLRERPRAVNSLLPTEPLLHAPAWCEGRPQGATVLHDISR
ncbi:hypothetical protein [Streptomyces sp. NPDC015414]|uniref:hypothetical protein n=1 Tax=Streptomyces sp. NPDC015414 TaxID=3364957 RepID=UPI003700415C